MTIGLTTKIFRALTDHLDIFASNESLSVAKPGLGFDPTSNTPYLKAYLIPTTTEAMDIAGLVNEYRGILQVNVLYPEGAGIVVAAETADRLVNHFESGTTLSHQATTFTISQPPHIGPVVEDPGWIMIPVSVRYRAFLTP
jgi:Bacteriophage related domain of unknown function